MRFRRPFLIAVFVLGCGKTLKPPEPLADSPVTVLDLARARPVPDPVRSRFHVKLNSPTLDVSGSTGGGLLLDRPGRGRADVFGPMGSTLLTLATDGEVVTVLVLRLRRHLHANAAEEAVREVTRGAAGLDDLLGVLVGDLPFDEAEVREVTISAEGLAIAHLDGPNDTHLEAWLDRTTAAPVRLVARDSDGVELLTAEYGDFTATDDGALLPEEVMLHLPALQLTTTVRYRKWEVLESVDDEVFQPAVPEGFSSTPLELSQSDERPSP
jgi:hypothetical protein